MILLPTVLGLKIYLLGLQRHLVPSGISAQLMNNSLISMAQGSEKYFAFLAECQELKS